MVPETSNLVCNLVVVTYSHDPATGREIPFFQNRAHPNVLNYLLFSFFIIACERLIHNPSKWNTSSFAKHTDQNCYNGQAFGYNIISFQFLCVNVIFAFDVVVSFVCISVSLSLGHPVFVAAESAYTSIIPHIASLPPIDP